MIHVAVLMPTTGLVRAECAMSLIKLAWHFQSVPVFSEVEQKISFSQWQSSCIANGREQLVSNALKQGCSHVLFVDEDIGFEPHLLHDLLRRKQPLVACNYRIRFDHFGFAAVSPDMNERISTLPESTGLQEIGFCGFGFCLIERAVFECLPQPWFPQHWHPESSTHTTEDVAFFLNARTAGFIPMIDHDASKKIIHVGSYRYRWDSSLKQHSN